MKVIRRLRKLSCKKLNLILDAIKTARRCTEIVRKERDRERERETESLEEMVTEIY